MKFRWINPLQGPRIEASGYEDAFADVGQDEMERRFSQRRRLFLALYDRRRPRESLVRYRDAAQRQEEYTYQPPVSSGPASLFLGGTVPKGALQKGGLPECQLLGFLDERGTVGCLAHPLAETSQGYDGRDQVGFFHHTGCCRNVGCQASREFPLLSPPARGVFAGTVAGMSWYRYSRHATSVLVHYLRSYDHLLQGLDGRGPMADLPLERLVAFTNALYEEWPLRSPGREDRPDPDPAAMAAPDILTTGLPRAEALLYIALGTRFLKDRFADQLRQARASLDRRLAAGPSAD